MSLLIKYCNIIGMGLGMSHASQHILTASIAKLYCVCFV